MESNRDKLEELAELLLKDEVIFKESLEEIFGKRQWKSRTEIVEDMNKVNVGKPKNRGRRPVPKPNNSKPEENTESKES